MVSPRALLERIFVAAADEERQLAAICVEDAAEIEPGSLGTVVGDKTGAFVYPRDARVVGVFACACALAAEHVRHRDVALDVYVRRGAAT